MPKLKEKIMSQPTSALKTACIGGFTLSALHACWVVIVASGWAQPVLDFILNLHMLNSPFVVQPFSILVSAELLALTFVIGAFYGLVFSFIRKLLKK